MFAQLGSYSILKLFVCFTFFGAILPLVAKQRGFIDVLGDLVKSYSLYDAAAKEGRSENRVVTDNLGGAAGKIFLRAIPGSEVRTSE